MATARESGRSARLVIRAPVTTCVLVGLDRALLVTLCIVGALFVLGAPIPVAVGCGASVALSIVARAALIEVRVTDRGIRLRNLFKTMHVEWAELSALGRGGQIHIGGRPYDQLLTLRLRSGAEVKALGTLSLTSAKLERNRRALNAVARKSWHPYPFGRG